MGRPSVAPLNCPSTADGYTVRWKFASDTGPRCHPSWHLRQPRVERIRTLRAISRAHAEQCQKRSRVCERYLAGSTTNNGKLTDTGWSTPSTSSRIHSRAYILTLGHGQTPKVLGYNANRTMPRTPMGSRVQMIFI